MHLTNHTAIIIGGSSGIGLATARCLSSRHAQVIVTGRDAGKLASVDHGIRTQSVDAASRPALDRFFAATGPFDHLILCASGAEGGGAFATLDLESLRRGFEAKFWLHVQAAQASLATLKPGGSITFVSAISARMTNPGTSGLAAINGALEVMVPILASELRPTRVNAVSPGAVRTPWWNGVPEAQRNAMFASMASASPVGRIGEADDIAEAIAFVVANRFVTGSVIECDGGLHVGAAAAG